MPTLSARPIKQPRNFHRCCACNRIISENAIRLYGMADLGDKPSHPYFHAACLEHDEDPKIRAAVEYFATRTPTVNPETSDELDE